MDEISDHIGLEAMEAPVLAKEVAEGRLPPLNERLPEKPLVAKHEYAGFEQAGVYGGTWHNFHSGTDLGTWKMIGAYAPLIRWNWACTDLEPGLAESWSFNEDGTELTLKLRRGVRWSDGEPYTSEAFAFWYELCLDDRHRYAPPVWSRVNGEPMTVETPDSYTIVMKFPGPNWLVRRSGDGAYAGPRSSGAERNPGGCRLSPRDGPNDARPDG